MAKPPEPLTEAEWLSATNPYRLLMNGLAEIGPSPRKLILFGLASLYRVEGLQDDQLLREAVESAEQMGEGRSATCDYLRARAKADAALEAAVEARMKIKNDSASQWALISAACNRSQGGLA